MEPKQLLAFTQQDSAMSKDSNQEENKNIPSLDLTIMKNFSSK